MLFNLLQSISLFPLSFVSDLPVFCPSVVADHLLNLVAFYFYFLPAHLLKFVVIIEQWVLLIHSDVSFIDAFRVFVGKSFLLIWACFPCLHLDSWVFWVSSVWFWYTVIIMFILCQRTGIFMLKHIFSHFTIFRML